MGSATKIDAMLALRSEGRFLVGRDRIAILEAVARQGSITEAAKALGFSYKTAWDAVAAINNLMPRPVLITKAGGKRGGGATLTEEGHRLIAAFRRLEEKLARISTLIAEEGLDGPTDLLFWSVAMKTSARNVFHCTVTDVRRAPVNVEVVLKVSETHSIVAVITNDSANDLGIVEGREVMALVKASFVMLARPVPGLRLSTANLICGKVLERIDGGVNSEIVVDLGSGKTLTSIVTRSGADEMELHPGADVCAFFNTSQVILAVD
ncbi:TOBE domain-containing protein [Xanthobacter agilis]|uniref:Molybdate transport system regulatory protein n=1 Tax=Xanthobacter agilis TaxID=47492 RepID=A0ABU0LBZ6_XANAG|nr:TOBE domain-containing protein [Xanthobacter agilis]MDQ0504667.1 molybdate transport system regulatory protein [Xanthobacter agilis]